MSKQRNKKYNPRKHQRDLPAISRQLWTHSQERMGMIDQLRYASQINAAIDEACAEYSPPAFNMLGHFYRVARGVADAMKMRSFMAICDDARLALQEYYDSDGRSPIPDDLAVRIRTMTRGLIQLLDEVPKDVFDLAEKASRELLVIKVFEQFDSLPDDYLQVALDVFEGGKVREVAEKHGLPEVETATRAKIVAAIIYTIKTEHFMEDNAFPRTIEVVRKNAEAYATNLRLMMAARKLTNKEAA